MFRLMSLAVLMAAVPAVAADQAKSNDKPAAEKKICRTAQATGSIMTRRICHTQAEWDALAARGQNDLHRLRDMERSRSTVDANRE